VRRTQCDHKNFEPATLIQDTVSGPPVRCSTDTQGQMPPRQTILGKTCVPRLRSNFPLCTRRRSLPQNGAAVADFLIKPPKNVSYSAGCRALDLHQRKYCLRSLNLTHPWRWIGTTVAFVGNKTVDEYLEDSLVSTVTRMLANVETTQLVYRSMWRTNPVGYHAGPCEANGTEIGVRP